jgi:hypothetical protein
MAMGGCAAATAAIAASTITKINKGNNGKLRKNKTQLDKMITI